jgi:hypothetical protein
VRVGGRGELPKIRNKENAGENRRKDEVKEKRIRREGKRKK